MTYSVEIAFACSSAAVVISFMAISDYLIVKDDLRRWCERRVNPLRTVQSNDLSMMSIMKKWEDGYRAAELHSGVFNSLEREHPAFVAPLPLPRRKIPTIRRAYEWLLDDWRAA